MILYLMRNFGGILRYTKNSEHSILEIYAKFKGIREDKVRHQVRKYPPSELIKMNLEDIRSTHEIAEDAAFDNFLISRHVMVINEHTNSWNALIDLKIINYNNVYIFGSEFVRDKSNEFVYLNKIKSCMEKQLISYYESVSYSEKRSCKLLKERLMRQYGV